MKILNWIFIGSLLTGCSTLSGSLATGAASGAALGGLIGNQQGNGNQRDKQTIQGAAIGAGLGALIGYAAHAGNNKSVKTPDMKVQALGEDTKGPALMAPKVRRVWVPPQILGEKYIDGHFMYVIEKTSAWSN
jgi:hypothetical protein